MRSRYKEQSRVWNTGTAYSHNVQEGEGIKSFLTHDKNRLIGNLAAGVAHEIRNPLTTIKGFVQLLNMGVGKPEYYELIYSEIHKVEETVSRLIGLAETQSVNFHVNDIEFILERAIVAMNDLAQLKAIELTSNLEKGGASIYCDELQLQQVFENIIENAIEASPNNRQVSILCETTETHVHIIIKDQGAGISEERIEHLFEPYYCVKEKGIGFGLMISQKIVEEHSGTIQVSSELEIGTTIDICLPLFLE